MVVAVVNARVEPHVLVGLAKAGIRNEDIIDAIAIEVAHGGASWVVVSW
jgi:hypothetical protein